MAAATVLSTAGSSLAASSTAAAGGAGAARGATARQSDSPAGFWYGTDSNYIAIPGPAPYREPAIGGSYGGYIGMIGNWANWQHCGGKVVWSKTDASDARTNFTTYHLGIGTGAYWFMAGPGVDPHFNGTSKEAVAWGQAQAAAAIRDLNALRPKVTYPVRLPGRGAARQRAELHPGAGQRLERRLHLAVQRQGADRLTSPRRWTGPTSTASPTT